MTRSPTRRTFVTTLAALGLSTAVLFGGTGICRGQQAGGPKPDQLKKVEEALPADAPAKPQAARKVLVFGNAQGFVHSSIPLGQAAVAKMGEKTGAYASTITNDPAAFDDLSGYDAVVLVSTTGHFLVPKGPDMKKATDDEKAAWKDKEKQYKEKEKQRLQNLIAFVNDGKGLVGIHAATDAYYDVKEFGTLIGGYFHGHPWGNGIVYKIDDPSSPLTAMFKDSAGGAFQINDETYRFKDPYSRELLRVLTSIDNDKTKQVKEKEKDMRPDKDHAISWVKEHGKGRVFYCSHGHSEHVYWNPTMLKHYLAGIQYALGDLKAEATPSAKVAASGK